MRERRFLKNLLLGAEVRNLGAFPALWKLQDEFQESDFTEERLHDRLEAVEPGYGPLLRAIRAYEAIARRLQDAFDVLRAEAGRSDVQGFVVASIAKDADFVRCATNLHDRFEAAHEALGQVPAFGFDPVRATQPRNAVLAAGDAARIELKPRLHAAVDFTVFDMHATDLDQ